MSHRSGLCFFLLTMFTALHPAMAAEPVKVKILVAAQFEIGANSGDRAGEFQYWYDRYWKTASATDIPGAENPVFCNEDSVCGVELGMGKVRSSSSMTAILLDPRFDFSQTYFVITGVGGTPPGAGTIAAVFWADWLIDYDLGHRWAPEEGKPGAPVFSPRKGYESVRQIKINTDLVAWAYQLSKNTSMKDSESAKSYRKRYQQAQARRTPFVGVGAHLAADTFFHGPGLSAEAQYITDLYGAGTYVITEMEGIAVAYVIRKILSSDRILSLRSAVNFDQGSAGESTLEHLDPEPGNTPGGFDVGLQNNVAAGSVVVDFIISHWQQWQNQIPVFDTRQ
jgi:purine nucleoside permease